MPFLRWVIRARPDANVMAWQGANYVSKIMKGAEPSELPVEQPTQYQIHINLKTAKTLGL
jgi:putative ABC transport system substrate-binding protein